MAKDPVGAVPIGALVRHPADWFSDQVYTAAWYEQDNISGTGEMWIAIGVQNNDSLGRVMRIYGAAAFAEGGGGLGVYWQTNTFGAQVATGASIRPDRPAPNVTIFAEHQQTVLGTPNPFNFGPLAGIIGAPGFDSGNVASLFPLFIVPPGYLIVATTLQSSPVTGLTWWFEMANL